MKLEKEITEILRKSIVVQQENTRENAKPCDDTLSSTVHTPNSLSSEHMHAHSSNYSTYISNIHIISSSSDGFDDRVYESSGSQRRYSETVYLHYLVEIYRKMNTSDAKEKVTVSETEYNIILELFANEKGLKTLKISKNVHMLISAALNKKMQTIAATSKTPSSLRVFLGIVYLYSNKENISAIVNILSKASRIITRLRSAIAVLESLENVFKAQLEDSVDGIYVTKASCLNYISKHILLTNLVEIIHCKHLMYSTKERKKEILFQLLCTEEYSAFSQAIEGESAILEEAEEFYNEKECTYGVNEETYENTETLQISTQMECVETKCKVNSLAFKIFSMIKKRTCEWIEHENRATAQIEQQCHRIFNRHRTQVQQIFLSTEHIGAAECTEEKEQRCKTINEILTNTEKSMDQLMKIFSEMNKIKTSNRIVDIYIPPFKSISLLIKRLKRAVALEIKTAPYGSADVKKYQSHFIAHIPLLVPLSYFVPTDQIVYMGYLMYKHNLTESIEETDIYYIYETLTYRSNILDKIREHFTQEIANKITKFQKRVAADKALSRMARELAKSIRTDVLRYLIKDSPAILVDKIIGEIKKIYITPEHPHSAEKTKKRIQVLNKISEFKLPHSPYVSYSMLKEYLFQHSQKSRKSMHK
ncbi:hypothetical protein NEMIN01_0281 [Nematocida minor]|uniref:uncharacterized protein n=1 Tax=Nematocida minor TaxID=1912983 RepID=UPI00222114C4|nr:uncharacterized protein NEMIN01_0281 [Nematocida minor]KAI5189115.1 hypothetical protein NEMIN01_0281 [Nematocida minor]